MSGTVEYKGLSVTFEAVTDLSTYQFRFMKIASNGQVGSTSAGNMPCGVLQNKPGAAGVAAEVMVNGISKIELAATLAAGDIVMADGTGKAAALTGTTNRIAGILTKGGAANEIGSVLIMPGGFAAQT